MTKTLFVTFRNVLVRLELVVILHRERHSVCDLVHEDEVGTTYRHDPLSRSSIREPQEPKDTYEDR